MRASSRMLLRCLCGRGPSGCGCAPSDRDEHSSGSTKDTLVSASPGPEGARPELRQPRESRGRTVTFESGHAGGCGTSHPRPVRVLYPGRRRHHLPQLRSGVKFHDAPLHPSRLRQLQTAGTLQGAS